MDVLAIDHVRSLKEESCRGDNWKNQEVVALLNAIKVNNLMKGGPSGNQLGRLVEPLMGLTRTAHQITGKLKNLRKSYLTCKKKGCTPSALRECPHYDTLAEIYSTEKLGLDANNTSDCEGDKICSEKGIDLMFDVIRELELAPDLTLKSFSGKAVRLISKMLAARGICASVDQVKRTLLSLRKTYIETRDSKRRDESFRKSRRYGYLEALWGTMPLSNISKDNKSAKVKIEPKRERGDNWSDEETVVLLTSVKALGLTREASRNDERAAGQLHKALEDSGYVRSGAQIQRRLDNLKNNFQHAKRAKSEEEAIRRFPFYHLYESVFSSTEVCTTDAVDKSRRTLKREREPSIAEKACYSRSRAWSYDETLLMLSLLEEHNLNRLIAHRLSFQVACEVVEPLREHGYTRSAMQIQIKLRNLRRSYYQCIRAGSTEGAIVDCPFYYKLDVIFNKKPVETDGKGLRSNSRKLELVESESFNDHNYYNAAVVVDDRKTRRKVPEFVRIADSSSEDDYENNSEQVWLPVETICDDDDTTTGKYDVFIDDASLSFDEEIAAQAAMCPEANASNERMNLEDPLKESTIRLGVEDRDNDDDNNDNITKEYARKNDDSSSTETTCNTKTRDGSCQQSQRRRRRRRSVRDNSATFEAVTRKQRNVANPYSLRTKKQNSSILRSMRIVMAEVLRHEKLLQRQHHVWMERQFEMQRKHDRDQRDLLVMELREFRKSWSIPKVQQQ